MYNTLYFIKGFVPATGRGGSGRGGRGRGGGRGAPRASLSQRGGGRNSGGGIIKIRLY